MITFRKSREHKGNIKEIYFMSIQSTIWYMLAFEIETGETSKAEDIFINSYITEC